MRTIVFTKGFAVKKAGDEGRYDGQLAYHLVNIEKVAKYKFEIADEPKSKRQLKKEAKNGKPAEIADEPKGEPIEPVAVPEKKAKNSKQHSKQQ